MISAIFAIAFIGLCALVFDREYLFSAPGGVVQVDSPTPVAALDEVTVKAGP